MWRALVFGAALAACTSESGPECELEPGVYYPTVVELSGDCGDLPMSRDLAVTPGSVPVYGEGCPGAMSERVDACTVLTNASCPATTMDGMVLDVDIAGETTVTSAVSASSEITVTIRGECQSRYRITYQMR